MPTWCCRLKFGNFSSRNTTFHGNENKTYPKTFTFRHFFLWYSLVFRVSLILSILSRDTIFCMLAYKISLLIIHNTFSVQFLRVPLLEIWIGGLRLLSKAIRATDFKHRGKHITWSIKTLFVLKI